MDGALVSGRDGVGADAAVGRRQVDGESGGGDDALVVVRRALPDVPFDKGRGGRGVGHGAGRVRGVAAVGRGLPAAAADLRGAVRARFGGRGRVAKIFAVRIRVGERRAARRRGDVTARVTGTAARQHRRRGVLLVFIRVGRRGAAVRVVLARHGREYVRAVHGFQAVRRGDQFDGRRRRVHLGDERRRGRRRAVYRPAVVLRRMVSATVFLFHGTAVVVVVRLLAVVVVDHVHDQLLLVLLLLLATVTRRHQYDFRPSYSAADRLQPVRIAGLVRPAAAVMAQVLRFALERLLVQEQSLQVAQMAGTDL